MDVHVYIHKFLDLISMYNMCIYVSYQHNRNECSRVSQEFKKDQNMPDGKKIMHFFYRWVRDILSLKLNNWQFLLLSIQNGKILINLQNLNYKIYLLK